MKNLLLLLYSVCVWECTFSQENASLRSKTPLDFRLRFNLENDSSVVRLFDTSFLRLVPGKALREYLRTFKDKFGYLNALSLQNSTTTEDQYAASFTLDSNFIMRLSVNRSGKISSMFIRPKVTSDTSVKHTNNIWLKKFNLNIPGSILIPPAVVHPPIVIFVAGSGPTDRNGNNEFGLRTNAYLKISTALLEKGIGSLRYDKRLSGEIYKVDERSVLVDSLVDDLRGWINKLRIEYPNSKIVIFGHSEGALVGMVAAQTSPVDGFVSACASSLNYEKLLLKQIRSKYQPDLQIEAKSILDEIKMTDKMNSSSSPLLSTIFRPSIIPFLSSIIKIEPTVEIAKLKCPILFIQGTQDLQVDSNDAILLRKHCKNGQLKIISGMNHIFISVNNDEASNINTYSSPDLPLHKELVPIITSFINLIK